MSTFPRSSRALAAAVVGATVLVVPILARAQLPLPPRAPVTQLEMGFDLSQGVIRLDVDLGSARAAKLVLDTGNSSSTIDLDAARSFGLPLDESRKKSLDPVKEFGPPGEKKKLADNAQVLEYYTLTPERVRLGSETFTGNVFIAAPLSRTISEEYGVTCDGTLGYGVFKGRVLQIDYPARKLRLLGSAPATTATAASLPIQWRPYQKGGPPLVTVDRLMLGSRAVCGQIDTFFAGPLILFPRKEAGAEPEPAAGIPGTYFEQAMLAAAKLTESATLGAATCSKGSVCYLAGKGAHTPEGEIAAVVGNGFFQDSVLTLDFQNDRVLVTPSHGIAQSDFPLGTQP
jgi:hypothetical protein